MVFEVGETVVYPHHGAATIEEIKTRTVKGEEKMYLKLKVTQGDLVIEVPAENVDLVGVRDVVDEELEGLRDGRLGDTGEEVAHLQRRPPGVEAAPERAGGEAVDGGAAAGLHVGEQVQPAPEAGPLEDGLDVADGIVDGVHGAHLLRTASVSCRSAHLGAEVDRTGRDPVPRGRGDP